MFSDINISQGSVTTRLWYGGIFSYHFTANLSLSLTVEEFWKLVKVWQGYRHDFGSLLFGTQCIAWCMLLRGARLTIRQSHRCIDDWKNWTVFFSTEAPSAYPVGLSEWCYNRVQLYPNIRALSPGTLFQPLKISGFFAFFVTRRTAVVGLVRIASWWRWASTVVYNTSTVTAADNANSSKDSAYQSWHNVK